MDKPVAAPAVGAKEKIDKQARQLAYDTRYKVKQSMKAKAGGRVDPAAMRKAFISQLAKSPSAPAVKARAKQMLMGEGYIDVKDLVKGHTANALFKVFVEHHKKDADGNTIPHEDEEITEAKDEKTFKVRVTDKKTGNSYVRMASRAKIADLRSNPNISSVEMTSYGEPTKSEKYKGKSTAKAKQGLDPVGKEDGDVDNDGDKDSSDKYLMKRRKAIGKAIASSEDKVWTDFKGLVEKKESEEKKITGEGVNNKKLIKVFPDEVREEMEKKEEPKQDVGLKQKQRKANMAKKQVLMKKMQAVRMGAGDQIMASKEADGDLVDEGMLVNVAKGVETGVKKFNKFDDKITKAAGKKVKKVAKKAGMAVLRGTAGAVGGAIKGAYQGAGKGIKKGLREEDYPSVQQAVQALDELKLSPKEKEGLNKSVKAAVSKAAAKTGLNRPEAMRFNRKEEVEMKPEMDTKPKSKKEKKEEDDPRSMPTKINLAKNKLRAMGLNMGYEHDKGLLDAYMKVHDNIEEDADKVSDKAYERAKTLGARRRSSYEYRKKGSFGPGKNERAGYNLSQSQKSRNRSTETQAGNQTGGGAKSFGFARNKSNPIKSKSVGDSGAVGHRKKRDEKVTTKKDGKTPLKTPRYKLSMGKRVDHHSSRRQELKDPKKNPKHTANK